MDSLQLQDLACGVGEEKSKSFPQAFGEFMFSQGSLRMI
jgi:hypothetical protein